MYETQWIPKSYDWPRSPEFAAPYTAQIKTADALYNNKRFFVMSSMRTGKTLSALWAADALMQDAERQNLRLRAVIIAPLQTLKFTWQAAIHKHFLGRRSCIVVHGTALERLKALEEDADFYIINPDGLLSGMLEYRGGIAAALHLRKDVDLAIIDESRAYKSPGTQRFKKSALFLRSRKWLWLMSGTPVSNGPLDAYGQAKLLNNAHGETLTAYRDRVMMKIGPFIWVPKVGAYETAMELLSPSIRFTQDECFDAQQLVRERIEAPMSAQQKRAYRALKDEFIAEVKLGVKVTATNSGVLRIKLLQIACGHIYTGEGDVNLDATPRINILLDEIGRSDNSVIVLAPFVHVIDYLRGAISKHYTCAVAYGGVSHAERAKEMAAFLRGDAKVLLATAGPISRGLDLTIADKIIWYAPPDKTEEYLQANERINGPNQKNIRTIVQICGSPVEEEMYKRLDRNESLQDAVLKLLEWRDE